MNKVNDFQKKQLDAIQAFYVDVKTRTKKNISMTDAIISWFTEGYAEKFRDDYLRNHIMVS